MERLNDNITDKLSRREIFEAVRKLKVVRERQSKSAMNMKNDENVRV
jgi:hypothetical protein